MRQELGTLLLKAGRLDDAEQVFREDLRRFPNNLSSQQGLAEALRSLNREAEAEALAERVRDIRAAIPE